MDPRIFPFLALPLLLAVASRRRFDWRALGRIAVVTAIAALVVLAPPLSLLPSLRAASLALFGLDAIGLGLAARALTRTPAVQPYRADAKRAFEIALLALMADLACLAASLAAAAFAK